MVQDEAAGPALSGAPGSPARRARRRVAFVVTEFPKVTETFIVREVLEMQRLGFDVRIYHLTTFNKGETLHDFARPALGIAKGFPYLSGAVLATAARFVARAPGTAAALVARIVEGAWNDPVMMLKSFFILPKSLAIAGDLQAWNADHVHAAYAGHPSTCAWIVKSFTGIPFSSSSHAHDLFETQALLRQKLPAASFVRTISDFNRRFILEKVPELAGSPPHVIHVGIDFAGTPRAEADRSHVPFRILYVGSLESRKGVDTLLRAVARFGLEDWSLRIAGGGPERGRLERLAAELGLENRVEFLGSLPFERVSAEMSVASVLVVPSRIGPRNQTEGLPTVIAEAFAHSLPVIATRLTGIPEIVVAGRTGYLFDVDDVDGLVARLHAVSGNYPEALAFAREGHRLVVEEFDLGKNVTALSGLIDTEIRRHAQARAQEGRP